MPFDHANPTARAPRPSTAARWLCATLAAFAVCADALTAQAEPGAASAPAVAVSAGPTPGDPAARLLAQDARKWLDDADPIVRGEAALLVAAAQDESSYAELLTVAKDPEPEARLRGILAVGYLGAEVATGPLDQWIRDSGTRPQPEGVVAAYALGLLPQDVAASTVSSYLRRFVGMSFKRQRDLLLALLHALSAAPAPDQRAALAQLIDNPSVRDHEVRAALLRALGSIPSGLGPGRVEATLRRGSAPERRAVLQALAANEDEVDEALTRLVLRTAQRDDRPEVRAAALAALTRLRHLPALELAARMVRSNAPVEVEQGARSALHLGGSAMRRALERQLELLDDAGKAAVLRAFSGPLSAAFAEQVAALAADPRRDLGLRTAAALALAQADLPAAAPLLRDLFAANADVAVLTQMARALLRLGDAPPELDVLLGPRPVDELADAPVHLQALLRAGHPAALRYCTSRTDVDARTTAGVLRALRASILPQPTDRFAGPLPAPLDELLR